MYALLVLRSVCTYCCHCPLYKSTEKYLKWLQKQRGMVNLSVKQACPSGLPKKTNTSKLHRSLLLSVYKGTCCQSRQWDSNSKDKKIYIKDGDIHSASLDDNLHIWYHVPILCSRYPCPTLLVQVWFMLLWFYATLSR